MKDRKEKSSKEEKKKKKPISRRNRPNPQNIPLTVAARAIGGGLGLTTDEARGND